jgi:hypothetical protein
MSASAPSTSSRLAAGRHRRPKGSPIGGQFAEELRTEPDVELAAAPGDGTVEAAAGVGLPPCLRCGQPGGIHRCASPVTDSSTSFRYSSIGRKVRAERMEADLTAAIEEVVSSGRLRAWLDRIAKNRLAKWSFGNQLLALWQIGGRREQLAEETGQRLEEMPPVMVMTAAAWEREFGRHPRVGESAVWINGPRTRKVTLVDSRTGEEREEFRLVGVSPVAEFDITQTEGPDLPVVEIARMTDGKVRPGSYAGLKQRIESSGYRLVEAPTAVADPRTGGGAFGWTDPAARTVQVDPRLSPSQKVETLAHELVHIVHGHVDDPSAYRRHRGRMETEAEASAYMIRRWLGAEDDTADHSSFSPGYIAGWSRGDVDQVRQSMSAATKVFQELIDGDWPDTDD